MWKANTKGLIDVKLETKSGKLTLIVVVQAVMMQRVQDGMRITTKPQHSATISYLIRVTIPRNMRTQNTIKPLLKSYVATDAEGRAKAYAKAEEILAKDFGIVPIFNYVNPRLVKPYVKGYSGKDPQDHIYLRNLYIIKH